MESSMIGKTLAHFHVLSEIGRGGMGQVYRALDSRLDREVAIKVLAPECASREHLMRLRHEAKALAALNHPNIVTIYSIEDAEGVTFLNMELVRGKPLSEVIPDGGLRLANFFELALPMVDALRAAHELGIAHRDLKPGNIMVSDEGRIKIFDFGIAAIQRTDRTELHSATTAETLALEDSISGTLPYMSPEQIQGKAARQLSDIFSLGIVLYEMITGRRPFRGNTSADIVAAILKDSPPPITSVGPDLPRQLDRILRHCLEKDTRRRIQVILDLQNQLEDLQREIDSPGAGAARSVAVLPFADMSPEQDQEYFCDGVAEEIIHALGQVRDLHVVSRTSAFRFKGTSMGSREIGQRLGATTLVEGSVRKAGDRVRITAELTSVSDGYTLWSERYDRDLQDIFAIQDEIARSIADAMKVTLSPEESLAIAKVATRDLEAYDFYLRGRQFYYLYSRKGMEFGLRLFNRAIQQDPEYARAYAGIADCCAFLYMYGGNAEETRRRSESASRKALELDPDLAEAHAARGVALSLSDRAEESKQAFETSVRLDPKLFEAYYFYARLCFAAGKEEKALELYEKAIRARPEDYQPPLLMAQIYEDLGRPAEAAASRRRGVRLAEAKLELNPDDSRALYLGANGLVALGERERGLKWARRALAIDPEEPMAVYNVACVQVLAGQNEEALDSLEQAVRSGLTQKDWIEHDSNLDPLRDHPRFKKLMQFLEQEIDG
jgi:non-specific serine/threonine protein kinase